MHTRAHRCLPATAVAAVAVAVIGAGCGSSQTSSQTAAHSTTAPSAATAPAAAACTPGQIRAVYAGSDGATGHMEVTIALRNVSARPCRVSGYPATRLSGLHGPLGLHVGHGGGFFPDGSARPRRIVIAAGGSAHYGVSFVTNNEYAGAHVCHQVTGASAALPDHPRAWQTVTLQRAPRLSPCGSRITVSAIHA